MIVHPKGERDVMMVVQVDAVEAGLDVATLVALETLVCSLVVITGIGSCAVKEDSPGSLMNRFVVIRSSSCFLPPLVVGAAKL